MYMVIGSMSGFATASKAVKNSVLSFQFIADGVLHKFEFSKLQMQKGKNRMGLLKQHHQLIVHLRRAEHSASKRSMSQVLRVVAVHLHQLNGVNLSTAVHRLARACEGCKASANRIKADPWK